jgi:hypothetical protein
MAFDPVKYPFDRVDPEHSEWVRLFLFWHAYDEEEKLLQDWHNSTAGVSKPTGNVLFDSFLNTWGKGNWGDVDTPANWSQRTYFQALGVVSHQLRQEIRDNVLDKILVPEGDRFKLPPELKKGVDPKEAERLAHDEINRIKDAFEKCEIKGLEQADECASKTVKNCPNDIYLQALLRMMLIETGCFKIQKHFLEEGTILTESAVLRSA